MIVIRHTQKSQPVPNQIDRRDGVLNHRPRESDQQPVLDDTGDIHSKRGSLPHEQKHSQIQSEGAERIGPEDHEIEMETRGIPQQRVLHHNPWERQENKATRRNIVKRSDWVQTNTSRIQQNLDQDQTRSLKSHSQELQHDTKRIELGLSVGGDGDAERDGEHVDHGVGLKRVLLEENADGVYSDGHQSFEHLDEGDGEVDVSGVGKPERKRVESSDGNHRLEIKVTCHGGWELNDLENANKEVSEG